MSVGIRPYVVTAAMGPMLLISPASRLAAQDANFHNAPVSSSQLKNPYAGQKAAASAGSRLYTMNCDVCHGIALGMKALLISCFRCRSIWTICQGFRK